MLEVKKLCAGYAGKEILHDVSLTVQAGQITAVLGPNGCGKSTLLKAICGILPVGSGQILLDSQDLLALPRNRIAQSVAYLAQNRQIPDSTVGRLVLHGRFPYLSYPRRYRREDYLAAEKAMEQLSIADLAETPVSRLSGGQQQRAYIAMALAQDTRVVLLDEPTTFLDVSYQLQMLRQARELAGAGKYVLMVIHDLAHALETADQVILMKEGAAGIQGTPDEVYETGMVDEIFGVRLCRVQAGGQWRYFFTEK